MISNPFSNTGEIDFRAIFKTLLKARKVIFITTLVVVVVVFAVNFWVIPRKYQATAFVYVGNPVVNFVQDLGLTISPTLPDVKAVVKLATAPGLLDNVAHDPAVVAAFRGKEFTIADMVSALNVGEDQILLQVTDTDPQRAAVLANVWAEKVTTVVNDTYGLGAISHTLDTQVLQSQQDYEKAQITLEDAMSKNQAQALDAQLKRKQADLQCVLESASQTRRVLDDLQDLERELGSVPAESPISLGDGLTLTTLRQRLLTSQPCQLEPAPNASVPNASVPNELGFSVQIDSASFAGFTVSKALEATTQMHAALQAQLTRLQSGQSSLEQEIPKLQRDFENANAQLTLVTLKRNQSGDIRDALLQQQQRIATVLAQSAKVASISVKAVAPDKKSSPAVLLNTVLAGMLGLTLVVFWVLATEWWQNSADKDKKISKT